MSFYSFIINTSKRSRVTTSSYLIFLAIEAGDGIGSFKRMVETRTKYHAQPPGLTTNDLNLNNTPIF